MQLKIFKNQNFEYLALLFIFGVLTYSFHIYEWDIILAKNFYSPGNGWIYRDNFFLEKVLHKGGVYLSMGILLGLILCRFFLKELKAKEKALLSFVISSTILSIVSVYLLKLFTTFPCPWNSQQFGGGQPLFSFSELFLSSHPKGHCFPAGHSSGGYAFLSLYFGFTLIYKKRSFLTLIPGIIIGFTFGMTQEIRGAHFLSHDLATIFVTIFSCFFISLITSWRASYYNKSYEDQNLTK
ncbi:MAG: phosphatase PAP2 family protein [Bdellovibrionales bacterium]|nr:phosphatase PAP2 family protein [Bdellovibrionales bacterium]